MLRHLFIRHARPLAAALLAVTALIAAANAIPPH